ncbi:MAG: dTDP-glucose 4,6-dehydratase [Magnetococcales bacterium]|nr:dTDP-glucose 4,6-dehydratase [Magnetococcales bacterium]
MEKLLVTGGAGFIGANFVRYWSRRHPQDRLVVLDALTYAGNLASLEASRGEGNWRFVRGSINDQELVERLLREEGIRTLVHFAAESHVDRSILGPDAFIETNIVGTHALLKAARRVWLDEGRAGERHRFHHVSTDEVYGSLRPEDPPFAEEHRYQPNSPYSASKAASDHLVRAYHHTYGLMVTTSNCSNNYGPFQFPEKLIPLMIVNILDNKPLPVYGDGLNVRDWLYVDDHCRGIDLILKQGRPGEVYNIGGNAEWKNIDIVRLLCRELDRAFAEDPALARRYPKGVLVARGASEELLTFVADRPGHDRRYAIDAGRIGRDLGYAPMENFATGIRKTIAWYLERESWWRPLQAPPTSLVR